MCGLFLLLVHFYHLNPCFSCPRNFLQFFEVPQKCHGMLLPWTTHFLERGTSCGKLPALGNRNCSSVYVSFCMFTVHSHINPAALNPAPDSYPSTTTSLIVFSLISFLVSSFNYLIIYLVRYLKNNDKTTVTVSTLPVQKYPQMRTPP